MVCLQTTVSIVLVMSLVMYYASDKISVRYTIYLFYHSFILWGKNGTSEFGKKGMYFSHLSLPIRNLSTPSGMPLKLAVISDIHAGASVHEEQVRREGRRKGKIVWLRCLEWLTKCYKCQWMQFLLWEISSMEPFVDWSIHWWTRNDVQVDDIAPRLKSIWTLASMKPTYFVTGNHGENTVIWTVIDEWSPDYYYYDVRAWLSLYEKKGIKVLHNKWEGRERGRGGGEYGREVNWLLTYLHLQSRDAEGSLSGGHWWHIGWKDWVRILSLPLAHSKCNLL